MKAAALSLLVAFSCLAAATPADKGYSVVRARDATPGQINKLVDLTFTGPIVVGGPNVTLSGTAQSIHAQILEQNPDYNPWDFPEYKEKMKAKGITRESQAERLGNLGKHSHGQLSKRGYVTCNPSGSPVGNWITQCAEGVVYLDNLNGYCGAPAGWGGCARVSCSHNCGISLCNDNPYPINVWCGNLVGDFFDIVDSCEVVYTDWVASVKGQVFRDGPPAWNTIVKSDSC